MVCIKGNGRFFFCCYLYRELLANRVFQQAVLIRVTAAGRVYTVEELP